MEWKIVCIVRQRIVVRSITVKAYSLCIIYDIAFNYYTEHNFQYYRINWFTNNRCIQYSHNKSVKWVQKYIIVNFYLTFNPKLNYKLTVTGIINSRIYSVQETYKTPNFFHRLCHQTPKHIRFHHQIYYVYYFSNVYVLYIFFNIMELFKIFLYLSTIATFFSNIRNNVFN